MSDLLRHHAGRVRTWIDHGAAVYVCGSRTGMGADVHRTLVALLGEDRVNELDAAGRYRRDLY